MSLNLRWSEPVAAPWMWLWWRTRWCLVFGQPRRAEACLTRLLAGAGPAPLHARALASRAVLRQARGKLGLALADARRLVACHPDRCAADWFNLGYLLEQAGHWREAADAFGQAVTRQPQLDLAWYGLGLARLKAGQLAQAVEPLTECTRLQPMSPHAWYQLARLKAELGDVAEARRLLDHLSGFEPGVAARLALELAPCGLAGRLAQPVNWRSD